MRSFCTFLGLTVLAATVPGCFSLRPGSEGGVDGAHEDRLNSTDSTSMVDASSLADVPDVSPERDGGGIDSGCTAGMTLLGGRCYALQTDRDNCGIVGFQCPESFRCRDGVCNTIVRDAFDPSIWPAMPSSRWQMAYRRTPSPFSGFSTYVNRFEDGAALYLNSPGVGDTDPSVKYWNSATVGPNGEGGNQVVFHPGPMGLWSVIRFVAPVAGRYNLIWGFWSRLATTNVRIDWNEDGSALTSVDVSVSGMIPSTGSRMNRRLAAAGFVDFGVNDGNNGHANDATTADLRIEYLGP